LSEVYKTLVQTIPDLARTPELDDVTDYLGSLIRGVDSSLLDEWERMKHPERELHLEADAEMEPEAPDITRDRRAFTALIRNLMLSLLRTLRDRDYELFLELVDSPATETGAPTLTATDLERELRPLFATGETIALDADARNPINTTIEVHDGFWNVRQAIRIGEDVSEYCVKGRIDLARSRTERRPVFLVEHVGAE
jgi:Domain of unknown function (DUF3516)